MARTTRPRKESLERRNNRIGRTPAARLRWILGFLNRDAAQLPSAEQESLVEDLRTFIGREAFAAGAKSYTVARFEGPALALLLDVLADLRHAIRSLVRGERWDLPTSGETWIMPLVKREHPPRRRFFLGSTYKDERDAIILGIAQLVLEAGEKLSACPECSTLFLGVKRQEFCSIDCSQKARNKRKQERKEARS